MGIKYRVVARAAGTAGALTGIAMLPALAVSLVFREYREAAGFAVCIVITLLLAGATCLSSRARTATDPEPRLRDAMLIVSVWWFVSSVLGGLPYMACGVLSGPADALFESASGFTTTGATVLPALAELPRGLALWRSVTGWLGGLEILAASLALLPPAGLYAAARIESSASLSERLPARERGAALRLFAVYAGGSLLLFLLLRVASTAPFDALILALGAVSTSGFSGRADGTVEVSDAAAFFLCAFMLLAAVNFTLYRRFSARLGKRILRDEELRCFFLALGCAACAIGLYFLIALPHGNALRDIGNAFFETASALTTTGCHRAAVFSWPPFCKLILLFCALMGGCVASTAGGIKVGRILILLRLLRRNISVRLHPNAVLAIKFDGKAVPTDTVNAVVAHAMLCIVVFFVAMTIVSLDGAGESGDSVFDVLACMSNAGPSLAATDWAAYGPPTKVFLSFLMILGRLEFTAVLLLFTPRYWKND
ncbi:MAG: TrkH family potassium uptake protein [Clostridiales Family XIII bacterium]|jgi:trk system potassium uptake protein TrkH|nr:TrkH family potassium uptake protein [Clostridiales Family XIII bacterium]